MISPEKNFYNQMKKLKKSNPKIGANHLQSKATPRIKNLKFKLSKIYLP